jgi:hypothetical protein
MPDGATLMHDGAPDSLTPDGAPALDRVVDDDTPRIEATEWAVESLYDDRPFEDVEADLVAGGWSADDAAEIVEAARQRTRRHRGATTRDQVVDEADRMYRRATGRWFVGLPMLSAAWRLLHSVATLLNLRRARRREREP